MSQYFPEPTYSCMNSIKSKVKRFTVATTPTKEEMESIYRLIRWQKDRESETKKYGEKC